MRLKQLLHLFAIVLVTVAAPLNSIDTEHLNNDKLITNDDSLSPHSTFGDDTDQQHLPPDPRAVIRPTKADHRYDPIAKPSSDSTETGSIQPGSDADRITDSSDTFDLAPFVEKFNMPHNIPMASTGDGVRELSTESMKNANVPSELRFTQGSFAATGLPKSLYKVTDAKRFQSAGVDLLGARLRAERVRANPQYGELALQSVMASSLFDPANGILSAITGSDSSVVWRAIGSGFSDPVPDVLLTAGKENAAVIEIKTSTAFPDVKFDQVMKLYDTFVMQPRRENGSDIYRLFEPKVEKPRKQKKPARPKSPKTTKTANKTANPKKKAKTNDPIKRTPPQQEEETQQFDRIARTKTMEQVVSQMYAHKVNIAALTNLDTWLIFEKPSIDSPSVSLTKLEGVVDGKSRALDIVLAITNKAAGSHLALKHSGV